MDPDTQPPSKGFFQVRWPSAAFWLQAGACAIVGWSLVHGALSVAPSSAAAAPAPSGVAPSGVAPSGAAAPASPAAPLPAPQLAAVPSLGAAALSTIDVIVARNDTLDRIFRRLKLNLADLASLRSSPHVRDALDS